MTEFEDDARTDYTRTVEDATRTWHATAIALETEYLDALERPGQDQSPSALHSQYLHRRRNEHAAWQARLEDATATYRERTGQTTLPQVGWTPAAPGALPAPGVPGQVTAAGGTMSRPRKGFDRQRWLPLIIVVGVLALLAVIGTAMAGAGKNKTTTSTGTDSTAYSSTFEVLYEVEGTATGANLTMEAPTGTVQGSGKAVPLANGTTGKRGITYTMPRGHFLYLSAQNTNSKGTITCRITVDGTVVSTNTSSGGYSIASCEGKAR
ncbi:hypothetical protein QFZ36_002695 [Pseudarthrobacter siccitolerans]|uniref:Tat (Twin-arginine translocation) pathway signal sequence domain protein n=1 Tax=Pseudarthrobacter siccitolerans TaxID=861266 RepID=A0ABU0PMD7_9MICC|nr:MmpS family transport accessory protein [Pseudarthrobacter siccitolerans]MDQ0675134.1 hypothetical protein [Pseudarthrobacter siccitolerans]